MRLLFFSLSAAAFGETFIGLSLAGQLRSSGVESHFVVPSVTGEAVASLGFGRTIVDYADCPTGEAARAFFDEIVARVRPDALVLADYNAFDRNVRFHFRTEPWLIEEYALPILPIDLSEWDRTDFTIDLCGRDPLPVSRKILDFPAHLRPVPTAHLDAGPSGRGFPYRVVAPERAAGAAEREAVFARYGLDGADRLILLPMSSWQQPAGGRGLGSEMSARLTETVPELLAHYLGELPAGAHVLVVGEAPPALPRRLGQRLHVIPPCPIDEYTTLLGSADVTIVFSPTSATAARAVLMDRPAVIMQNRYRVHDEADVARVDAELGLTARVRGWLDATTPIDPFRLWPKGCFAVQEPMLRANPYLDALVTAEILDETGTVAALHGLLYDKDAKDRLAAGRSRYLAAVNALPDAAHVVGAAIERAAAS